jgi:pectin methylesterase-like acyl-CoA thioesterase
VVICTNAQSDFRPTLVADEAQRYPISTKFASFSLKMMGIAPSAEDTSKAAEGISG